MRTTEREWQAHAAVLPYSSVALISILAIHACVKKCSLKAMWWVAKAGSGGVYQGLHASFQSRDCRLKNFILMDMLTGNNQPLAYA